MTEPTAVPNLPMYENRPGIPHWHPDLNMSPQKAAGILNKVAQAHSKGGRGKSKGKAKTVTRSTRMPADGRGARVFGGKR